MRSAVAVILLATSVLGIPSSLLEDVKIAKMMPDRAATMIKPNKVKRSHEELMYGDQQNHFPLYDDFQDYQRDLRFARTNKRDLTNGHYYSTYPDQRIKRTPMKRRSLSRIRSKRDSEIDPRELLPVLLLALSEEKLGMLNKDRVPWNNYGSDVDDSEWADNVDINNQLTDMDDPRNAEEWLNGPVIPGFNQVDDISPSRHWGFKDNDRKRFMVSKRYQNRGDSSIAQLFNNNQHWDYNVPVYRRMVL